MLDRQRPSAIEEFRNALSKEHPAAVIDARMQRALARLPSTATPQRREALERRLRNPTGGTSPSARITPPRASRCSP